MIKKLFLMTVCGALAFAALRSTKAFSYARQSVSEASDWASSQVPPERELKRLRAEVKALDGDVLRVAERLARENVDVRELRQAVADHRSKQSDLKEKLTSRGAAVKAATETVAFGDRKLPVAQAKAELAESVARYTTGQRTQDSLDATLASRERSREALEKQLDTLKAQRLEMTAAIDGLEAELTAVKLQQMESKYQCDDTRLSGIKESIRDMRKAIAVEREKLKLAPVVHDDDRPTAASANRSVDDILAPLADKPAATPAKGD